MKKNNNVTTKINQTIEDIWMNLEKKERQYIKPVLNNQQYVLLTWVIRHPFSSPSEIANKMEITKSAVSQQLARLEKDGYIIKKQHQTDKRTYSIHLDEKGKQYQREIDAFNQHIAQKYNEQLTFEELTQMLDSLQKLNKLLK